MSLGLSLSLFVVGLLILSSLLSRTSVDYLARSLVGSYSMYPALFLWSLRIKDLRVGALLLPVTTVNSLGRYLNVSLGWISKTIGRTFDLVPDSSRLNKNGRWHHI